MISYTLLQAQRPGANAPMDLQPLHRVVLDCIDEAIETLGQRGPQEIRYSRGFIEQDHLATFQIHVTCEISEPEHAQEVADRVAYRIARCTQLRPLREQIVGTFCVELILPDGCYFTAEFE